MKERFLKTVESRDKKRRLHFVCRNDCTFGFNEEELVLDRQGKPCWSPTVKSGFFDSELSAERAAKSEIVWFGAL